ncbi:MAG: hypothetical protein ACOVVK_07450 [Elsteraceae bacterium]
MKITSIEPGKVNASLPNLSFLRVVTDPDHLNGWSEAKWEWETRALVDC